MSVYALNWIVCGLVAPVSDEALMRTASVDTAPSQMKAHDRETLVYAEIQRAFASIPASECRVVVGQEANAASLLPGLEFVTPQAAIIALGFRAHVGLADVSKRTLIARDLCLDDAPEETAESIEQLVWSSVNTSKMIAVGTPAWESIQLLPAAELSFYETPPLAMRPADVDNPSILVIDHEGTAARAFSLVETLKTAALNVVRVDVSMKDPAYIQQSSWDDTAWIHVHVGEHTTKTEQPRLIDSWHNGRLTIHLLDRGGSLRHDASASYLTIHDQENGFVCSTANEVVAACRDLLSDPVLQHKVVEVGRSSVAPFSKAWHSIAEDLLS